MPLGTNHSDFGNQLFAARYETRGNRAAPLAVRRPRYEWETAPVHLTCLTTIRLRCCETPCYSGAAAARARTSAAASTGAYEART